MPDKINKGFIPKKEKGSGDFENLYLEGIELLQLLSGAEWTDYNEHDPGVTILENIAFSLTNLSLKANLPVQDILTENKGSKLESGDNGFFIPSEILTTNPVTQLDLRKLLIDQITNVKNVWIKLRNETPLHFLKNKHQNNLKGLYHIFVEMYDYHPDAALLRQEENRIIGETKTLFHAHRNLCEDLYDVTIFKPFQLRMKLKLTLDKTVSGEDVFATIYYKINDYLTHEIRFYSLWELRGNKRDINSIFNGPILENGFINDSELKDRLNCIIPADIVKIIANLKDVKSVDYFEIAYQNTKQTEADFISIKDEGYTIPENYSPVLLFPETNQDLLKFEQEGVLFYPDLIEVKKQLSYTLAMDYGSFKSVSQSFNIINIPQGKDLGIPSYYPITEQFPMVYGIGKFGLQKGLPAKRYAQANQLKAYLLPIDQLMTNFLSQLTHLYLIYDVKNTGIQSYFYQELEDMPELVQLIKSNAYESDKDALQQWKATLEELNLRFDKNAITRLNEVADNLLSRYSETFPDYAIKNINANCYGKEATDRLIDYKILSLKRKLISNYGKLGYNRAKAYNYALETKIKDVEVDDPKNEFTPEIVQKIALLMGIDNFQTRWLSKKVSASGIKIYRKKEGLDIISERLQIIYSKDDIDLIVADDVVIIDETEENLRDAFYFLGYSGNILNNVLKYGVMAENYSIKHTSNEKNTSYYVLFSNKHQKPGIVHISDSEEAAKNAINFSVDFLRELNEKSEGIYLLEHLFLAPPYQDNYFGFSFKIPLDNDFLLAFNHCVLKSNQERNNDVNELLANLCGSGTMQFRVISVDDKYVIQILTKKGNQLAVTTNTYPNKQAARDEVTLIVKQLYTFKPGQFAESVMYYAYYGKNKVDEVFFSFQMSFILPAWPVRFQDINFKKKFENVAYEQVPVHLVFQSYWLSLADMETFESCFYKWFNIASEKEMIQEKMTYAHELITMIQQFYEQATH